MKRVAELTAVLFPLVLFGCATTPQKGTMEHLSDNRQQMSQMRGQIDRTMYSLDSLMRSPPAEIRDAQARYASNVTSLRKMSDKLDADAKELRERKVDYLTEWERAQLNVESPALKRATEQRQKDVVQSINTLEASLNSANQGITPLVRELEDIAGVTGNDPTAPGIAAVRRSGIVQSAQKHAATANQRLDLAASRFDRALAALSPQPGTRPVTTATSPVSSKGAVAASGAGAATLPVFSQADRNASGAIEQEEAGQIQGLDLRSADRDKDGKLSESEYEAARKERATSAPAAR
jgi:hypothetical protein